ncbi:MAG TPA: hypothetical protein VGD46_04150 [Rhizobacter sp.]
MANATRFVITSAQNATGVHKGFLRALQRYCEHRGAQLLVIPFRYRNPTSVWSQKDDHEDWWDKAITPYLMDKRMPLANGRLLVLGDIKVQPTATSPLTGFDTITGSASAILGSPKLQMRCIPTPHKHLPKVTLTTGAITKQNYTDSKAGKKGDFHHTFGATVVETDGDVFHLRQINAMRDGSFHDLLWRYTASGVEDNGGIEALVMGDTHVDFVDPEVVSATFTDPDAMVKVLRPRTLVWHDLLDFYSKNHHHKDPFIGIAKRSTARDDVMAEIRRAVEFIDTHTPRGATSVLVPANHNEALGRWVREADWREDPVNAETYLETALAMVRTTRMTDAGSSTGDPFHYWIERLSTKLQQLRLLKRDDSWQVKGIEIAMHGDVGPNGVRGSVKSLSKIGVKSIIGHSHTPGIEEGCYQVGTSSRLRLEYNRGASSWLHTHCLIYRNGKRSLVSVIGGKWCHPDTFKEVVNANEQTRRRVRRAA